MSVKSIGLVSTGSGLRKDYDYPSIKIGSSGQIIEVKETSGFDTAALENVIAYWEQQIVELNIVVSQLNGEIAVLSPAVTTLQSDIDTMIQTQATLATTLSSLSTTIAQLTNFDANTTATSTITASDSGFLWDRNVKEAYYFQPNLGTDDYEAILYSPSQGMSYSLPSTPSSNLFLYTFNVTLGYFNPADSGEDDYIKAVGMLYITLRDGDNNIYHQYKDGNFTYYKQDNTFYALVSASGSAIVELPAGTKTFYPSIFVSSHNQDGFDANPIKSATSWVYIEGSPCLSNAGATPENPYPTDYQPFILTKI